jgi:hypothetical protein
MPCCCQLSAVSDVLHAPPAEVSITRKAPLLFA